MVQFDEKLYFYLLGIIPILVLLFLLVQVWKKSKQNEFAHTPMLKKLVPEKSKFKGTLKLIVFLLLFLHFMRVIGKYCHVFLDQVFIEED